MESTIGTYIERSINCKTYIKLFNCQIIFKKLIKRIPFNIKYQKFKIINSSCNRNCKKNDRIDA
jgi:hypothetical protein